MSTPADETVLARWLEDQLSAEEMARLQARADYEQLLQVKQLSEQLAVVPFDQGALYQRLNAALPTPAEPAVVRKRLPVWAWGLAAGIALLLAWYLWPAASIAELEPVQLIAESGQERQESLPDGSSLFLNDDSEVTYWIGSAQGERRLTLSGEAFLQVAKGGAFVVETEVGRVKVLGTEFSVFARDSVFRVQTYEGQVLVEQGTERDTLLAGEGLSFRWEAGWNKQALRFGETLPAWTEGTSTFFEVPLWEVMQEMERQYDVRLVPIGIDTQQVITTSFRHDDLAFNLDFVFDPLQVKWEERSDTEIVLRPK
ncbi:MAG: FecR domain-containing protein [Bacteroidota bacterium]